MIELKRHKRYSEMSEYELRTEIGRLAEQAKKAEQMGMINEFAVLERKEAMARAYLLNPDDFKPGEIYEIAGDSEGRFKINYMNGVFAWGSRLNGDGREQALPISLLRKIQS